MSIAELKKVVHAKVDEMNDEKILQEILEILGNKKINLAIHYDKIKEQYNDALQKLAQ
jgi:hypothetical protein